MRFKNKYMIKGTNREMRQEQKYDTVGWGDICSCSSFLPAPRPSKRAVGVRSREVWSSDTRCSSCMVQVRATPELFMAMWGGLF